MKAADIDQQQERTEQGKKRHTGEGWVAFFHKEKKSKKTATTKKETDPQGRKVKDIVFTVESCKKLEKTSDP